WNKQAFAIARIGHRELHLFAAFWKNILFSCNKIKALGFQTGYERSERRDRPINFFNTEFFEDDSGNVWANPLGFAALIHIAVGHLIGSGPTNKASAFEIINRHSNGWSTKAEDNCCRK